jgi:hypothetical protein
MRAVVGGVLRHLLAVTVQRRYNWFGQKGKKPFGSLKLAGVLYAVRLFVYTVPMFTLIVRIVERAMQNK